MEIKDLKISVTGPLWQVSEISVENIDVIEKWEENEDHDEGWVSIPDTDVFDENLDVFLRIGAPNHTKYEISITGKNNDKLINYSEEFTVEKNGILKVNISVPIL